MAESLCRLRRAFGCPAARHHQCPGPRRAAQALRWLDKRRPSVYPPLSSIPTILLTTVTYTSPVDLDEDDLPPGFTTVGFSDESPGARGELDGLCEFAQPYYVVANALVSVYPFTTLLNESAANYAIDLPTSSPSPRPYFAFWSRDTPETPRWTSCLTR